MPQKLCEVELQRARPALVLVRDAGERLARRADHPAAQARDDALGHTVDAAGRGRDGAEDLRLVVRAGPARRDGGAAAREAPAAAAVEGVSVAQVDAAELGGKRVEVRKEVAVEGGGRVRRQ